MLYTCKNYKAGIIVDLEIYVSWKVTDILASFGVMAIATGVLVIEAFYLIHFSYFCFFAWKHPNVGVATDLEIDIP